VDGDGIAARTLPGVSAKGAFFTRGSGHDKHGAYTEESAEYQEVIDRIARKISGAVNALPAPEFHSRGPAKAGLISLGGTHAAMLEAVDRLRENGIAVDYLRIRGFPFSPKVAEFIDAYDSVFVVEQNRDAQLRSLIAIETGAARDRMTPVLDYHGLPLTADVVVRAVTAALGGAPKKGAKRARKGAAV
jgi:2-oxoglutarate ferredoxin oxidoreductase subunit alpha